MSREITLSTVELELLVSCYCLAPQALCYLSESRMECHPRGTYLKQLDSYEVKTAGSTLTLFALRKL